MYRYRSGWITSGNLHLRQHGVMTETVEVTSIDTNVLRAEIVRQLAILTTLQPGRARLTLKTSKLDKRLQRVDALIRDSIALTIRPAAHLRP